MDFTTLQLLGTALGLSVELTASVPNCGVFVWRYCFQAAIAVTSGLLLRRIQ